MFVSRKSVNKFMDGTNKGQTKTEYPAVECFANQDVRRFYSLYTVNLK